MCREVAEAHRNRKIVKIPTAFAAGEGLLQTLYPKLSQLRLSMRTLK